MPTGLEKRSRLSWKPKRSGKKYCSPACGGGCTWDAYQRAQRDAQKLAEHLGPTWIPKVWENLGWHYKAVSSNGKLKVHPSIWQGKITGYIAFLGEGEFGGRWVVDYEDPREAVRVVIQTAKDDILGELAMLLEILPC